MSGHVSPLDIEIRQLDQLRPHPENSVIFGDPEDSPEYDEIRKSIKQNGLWEPLVIRDDGTILSGHLRVAVLRELGKKSAPCRVMSFDSYREEVTFLVRSNTDRRQLSKDQLAYAFKRMRSIPPEEGGVKRKQGRPKDITRDGEKSSSGGQVSSRSDDAAAEVLGVGTKEARALEAVFCEDDVPAEVKEAVKNDKVAPTPAAKAIKTERERQGGKITNPAPLVKWMEDRSKKKPEPTHEDRVAQEAEVFSKSMRALFDAYTIVNNTLTRVPLKSVIGAKDHHDYMAMIKDISLRAWREIETVHGDSGLGKQMSLTVISGGKE